MKKSVLILDKDEDFCWTTKTCLERTEEYTVYIASSGVEGLRVVRQARPDIFLLDVDTMERCCPEVSRALVVSSELAAIPVIYLLTWLKQSGHAAGIRGAGGRAFLNKPVPPETLLQAIRAIMKESASWKAI